MHLMLHVHSPSDLRPDSGSGLRRQLFWGLVVISSLTTTTAVHARINPIASHSVINSAGAAQDPGATPLLPPDRPIERELKGGESHSHRIALVSGQFMRAVVEQRGVNVRLTLFGPQGERLTEMNRVLLPQGTESLFHVAESSGDYRLEVRATENDAKPGRYAVRIAEVRAATARDRTRATAQRLFAEALQQTRQSGSLESQRKAIEKYSEAAMLWRDAADPNEEWRTLSSIGHLYRGLNEHQKAREYFEQLLLVTRAAGDRVGEGWATSGLSWVYGNLGETQKTLEYLSAALAIFREAGDKQGEVAMLNQIGMTYYYGFEEYQKALEFLTQGFSLAQSTGYRWGEANALYWLGVVYWTVGEYQESLDSYSKSLAFWRAAEEKSQEMTTLDNMGLVYYAMGDHRKALECYAQTLAFRRAKGQRSPEADTLTGIGAAYAALGENQQALESLNQGLSIYREVGNRQGVPYALRHIGNVYIAMNEPLKALDHFNQALPLDRGLRDQTAEARGLAGMAVAYRDLGDLNKARYHIEETLAITESLRSRLTSQELRTTYFASKWSYYQFYIDLLMRLDEQKPGAGYDAAALQASERARARSLLDLLAEAKVDVSEGIDPALKQKEKEIQARISRLNSRMIEALGAATANKDLLEQVKEELKQTENSREQLETEIRKKHPKYAELKYPTPLKLEEIQGLLDERTALLEYSLGQERSFLYVVSKEGLSSYSLPGAAEINRLAQEVRSALDQPGRRELGRYVTAARKLYDLLVAPAAGQLKKKQQLLIVPDGVLYYLPFEALLTAQPNTINQRELDYLLKSWAVSYVPSASVLANLRRSEPATEHKIGGQERKEFLAFAAPIYRAPHHSSSTAEHKVTRIVRSIFDQQDRLDLQELKDSGREVAGIAKFYQPQQTAIYLGAAAKEESVKSNEHLPGARRIHFATHGLISERMPQHSGLVLTLDQDAREDGLLQVYEIFNLKLSADLVVLSACRTGLGKEVRGEGVIGLTRAFLYAGASTVTVSLWQVADRSTSDLMIHFYEQMNAGHGKTEALRRAKLRMIEDSRHRHPFYWAPFILIGEPDG